MTIRAQVLTRFPARVLGGTGISVTKSGGVYTIALNTTLPADGVWSNTRLAKTGAYIATNADKGKTIALGGTSYYSLTFAAASGYDSNYAVLVVNEDSRGKKLVISGITDFILWPGQSCFVYNQNNAWKVHGRPIRWVLSGNTTFYVRTDGVDTNDGLANTAAGAFLTIQAAVNAARMVDANSVSVIIQVADGTYADPFTVDGIILNAANNFSILGNITTPANCHISSTAGCIICQGEARLNLGGFKLTSTSGAGLLVRSGAKVTMSAPMEYGDVGLDHIQVSGGGSDVIITPTVADYTISGSSVNSHHHIIGGASMGCDNVHITLTGTPSWGGYFVGNAWGISTYSGCTFTGSGTGQKYFCHFAGILRAPGSGVSFPGSVAGVGSGGCIDDVVASLGSTDGVAALASEVGEMKESTSGNTSIVTATAKTIASLTLTPGEWDICGSMQFQPDNTTTLARVEASISTVTNTRNPTVGQYDCFDYSSGGTQVGFADVTRAVSPFVVRSTASVTYYLVAYSVFGVSTNSALGNIRARRMR